MESVKLPKKTFIGYLKQLPLNEGNRRELIAEFWRKHSTNEKFEKLIDYMVSDDLFGITFNNLDHSPLYFFGVETNHDITSNVLDVVTIPNGDYSLFECVGKIGDELRNVEEAFLDSNKDINGPIIELYPNIDTDSDKYICYLFIKSEDKRNDLYN